MKNSKNVLKKHNKNIVSLEFPGIPDERFQKTKLFIHYDAKHPERSEFIPAVWVGKTLMIPKGKLLYYLIGPDEEGGGFKR